MNLKLTFLPLLVCLLGGWGCKTKAPVYKTIDIDVDGICGAQMDTVHWSRGDMIAIDTGCSVDMRQAAAKDGVLKNGGRLTCCTNIFIDSNDTKMLGYVLYHGYRAGIGLTHVTCTIGPDTIFGNGNRMALYLKNYKLSPLKPGQ